MENILRIECSDKRLAAGFEAVMQEKFGHCYKIAVPGPDAGVAGNQEHLDALVYFVKYFCDLVSFNRIIITVHEDCAGCRCSVSEHEQHVKKLAEVIRGIEGAPADIETYIARRPAEDDFAVWEIDEIR